MAPPLGDAPDLSVEFDQRILDAFANGKKTSGFLPLAEDALVHMPGAPHVLVLAATAALLDNEPERAQVFLKRFSKRYVPTATCHLLHALALELQNKPAMARAVLEQYGLTSSLAAMQVFPGGWGRRAWLLERLERILRKPAGGATAATVPKANKAAPKTAAKPSTKAGYWGPAGTADKTATKPPSRTVPKTAS